MIDQLIAFKEELKYSLEKLQILIKNLLNLFGVEAPKFEKEYFDNLLKELDNIVPGKGDLNQRINIITNKFIIPEDKLDLVFKAAIEEARKKNKITI
jgi:hypothetical protein